MSYHKQYVHKNLMGRKDTGIYKYLFIESFGRRMCVFEYDVDISIFLTSMSSVYLF